MFFDGTLTDSKKRRFRCPCCGNYTLPTGPGNYDVCPVCFWEDDPTQNRQPNLRGGANLVSLFEAKENYDVFGACEERFIERVRTPFFEEKPEKGECDGEANGYYDGMNCHDCEDDVNNDEMNCRDCEAQYCEKISDEELEKLALEAGENFDEDKFLGKK